MTKNSEIGEILKFRKLGSQLRARLFEELGEVVAHRFEASSVLEQACTGLSPAAACGSGSSGAGRALKLDWRGRRTSGVGRGARPPPAGRSSPVLAKREAALRGGRALRLLVTVKIASRADADDCGNEKMMAKERTSRVTGAYGREPDGILAFTNIESLTIAKKLPKQWQSVIPFEMVSPPTNGQISGKRIGRLR
jgi:hypothetical protein